MADTIRYQYEANFAALDDIQTATNEAQALADSVNKVFDALTDVYRGLAANELQTQRIQISQAMDAVLVEITQTRSGGNQSQDDARALDAHLAGGF
ncbi:hypothetical protein ACRCUN_32140 [Mycobacterium sp. LTG2003]